MTKYKKLIAAAYEAHSRLGKVVNGTWPERLKTPGGNVFFSYTRVAREHAAAVLTLAAAPTALRLAAAAQMRPMFEALGRAIRNRNETNAERLKERLHAERSEMGMFRSQKNKAGVEVNLPSGINELELGVILGARIGLNYRASDELMEDGKTPAHATLYEMMNAAVHSNFWFVQKIWKEEEGFDSNHVPQRVAATAVRVTTDVLSATTLLVADNVTPDGERKRGMGRRIIEIDEEWKGKWGEYCRK